MDVTEVILFFSTIVCFTKQGSSAYSGRRRLQPVFLPTPTNVTAYRGQTVALKCHVRDLGTRTVVWRRNDSDIPLTIGEAVYTSENSLKMSLNVNNSAELDESTWNLILKDVTPNNSGTYLCQITASKLYLRYISLEVYDSPAPPSDKLKAVQITGSIYVNELCQIRLECIATDVWGPPDEIEWFFEGTKITTNGHWSKRTTVTKYKKDRSYISELIVDRATTEDGGNYVCRSPISSNMVFDSRTIHVLSVQDAFDCAQVDKNGVMKRDEYKYPEVESKSSGGNVLCDKCLLYLISIYTCTLTVNLSIVFQYILSQMCTLLHCVRHTIFQLIVNRYRRRRKVTR